MEETWTIYTDGGARGNPGPAAYAYVIQRPGLADIEEKAFLGHSTNNIAEYTGLVKALEHARHLGGQRLLVLSDSELMVKQMNGEYRVKHPGLLPLYEEAVALRRDFEDVEIRHVRRGHNKQADRLCNEALDHPEDNMPFPVPLPPASAPAPQAKATVPRAGTEELRSHAVAILTESGTPDPQAVWDRLWQMLVKAKAVRKSLR